MTAYSRASCSTSFGRVTIEIHSLNRRHLEILVNLPREWQEFDATIKERIGEEIHRGQVTVTVTASFERELPFAVRPNLPLAHALKTAWQKVAETLQAPLDTDRCLELLSKEPNLLLYEANPKDLAELTKIIGDTLESCLKQCVAMKALEGERLQADLMARLNWMKAAMEQIAQKAPTAVERYREKLKGRLEELMGSSLENEEKILREVVLFADKVDITEEITRFFSHLSQLDQLFSSPVTTVGKKGEFLLQELNREANTIAAKSSEVEIGSLVIGIKTEIERIREQIQNVE